MKNLTFRYSITQFAYWAGSAGATSFATTYLLSKGFPPGIVGILLALGGLLSFLSQPLLASIADSSKTFVLPKMLMVMSSLCVVCFAVQLLSETPLFMIGTCYVAGIWASDAMHPLINALCVAYNQSNYSVNYSAARGIGSIATAVSTLLLGFVVARLGAAAMFIFPVLFRLLNIFVLSGYPRIEKKAVSAGAAQANCSIPAFFSKYRWYSISLLGILLLGMYHAMTENYLIIIMEKLGGNSSNVGMALFISAIVTFPVIFFFENVRKHIRDTNLLKIAALSFLAKAVLLYFARDIKTIYLLQLIQITSYAFLAPTQVYYAKSKVHPSDMVKGQAFITAAYALGCSAGNFTGGQLLSAGVNVILIAGIVMALAGTLVVFLSVDKSDFNDEEYRL